MDICVSALIFYSKIISNTFIKLSISSKITLLKQTFISLFINNKIKMLNSLNDRFNCIEYWKLYYVPKSGVYKQYFNYYFKT